MIRSLITLSPPHDATDEPATLSQWCDVEAILKTGLPDDYKELTGYYGAGGIAGFISIFDPFTNNPHLNLLRQTERILGALEEIRRDEPSEVPFPSYPEPDGLLPWAITDNGDMLFWSTHGTPEQWTVVILESRGPDIETFDVGAVEFLVRLLSQEITSEIIDYDLLHVNCP